MFFSRSILFLLWALCLTMPHTASADDLDELLDYLITSKKAEKVEASKSSSEDSKQTGSKKAKDDKQKKISSVAQ